MLMAMRPKGYDPEEFIFRSKKGGHYRLWRFFEPRLEGVTRTAMVEKLMVW